VAQQEGETENGMCCSTLMTSPARVRFINLPAVYLQCAAGRRGRAVGKKKRRLGEVRSGSAD
jgi:hypothetical protein